MMKFKEGFNVKAAILAISIVLLFTNTLYSTPPFSILRVQAGKDDTFKRISDVMQNLYVMHENDIDTIIQDFARQGKIEPLSKFPELYAEFIKTIEESAANDMYERLDNILGNAKEKIQIILIDNYNELPVFDGKKVWGHAGIYITVFAKRGSEKTEQGEKAIIGKIFHEIRARSTSAENMFNSRMPNNIWKARSLMKEFDKKSEEIEAQIIEYGKINDPALSLEFASLTFNENISIFNRDYTSFDRREFLRLIGVSSVALALPVGKVFSEGFKDDSIDAQVEDFTPAKVLDSITGNGFKQNNVIEMSPNNNRLIHILTDLTDVGEGKKVIKWHWSEPGESWTSKKWNSGSEIRDVSGNDLVFRFVISGTPSSEYKIIFEDNQGQRIEISSTEYLSTSSAEQYWLIKLDDDLKKRNSAFNWQAVKPPIFKTVTLQADVFIKRIEILNVRDVRARGVSVGMFFHTDSIPGNDFPALSGYAGKAIPGGRPPACVLSFSSLIDRDPWKMLELWNKLLPGQVPHEVLEMWLPKKGAPGGGIIEDAGYVSNMRNTAADTRARILSGEKVASLAKAASSQTVFERIADGEFDGILRDRALAAKQYGRPVMLRVFHEMMGGWYPWSIFNEKDVGDFIKAWKHIVTIYRDNGATNVAFGLSPHTYEPDYLPQTRKFQVLDNILWHLLNDAEGPMVDFVGIDAYSYPPQGGYFNELVTECLETVGKHGIPVIMGETSSAMEENDKRIFWGYKKGDLNGGMFSNPLMQDTVIFSIEKFENGSMKNFHPPSDIMEQWEKDPFFGTNAFKDLPGKSQGRKQGIDEPLLPQGTSSIASWVNQATNQRFTMIPRNNIEECFWGPWSGAWQGQGFSVSNSELKDNNYSEFELAMPMEIIEGDFNFIIEDNDFRDVGGGVFVGNEIYLSKNTLAKYIMDQELVITLDKIIELGQFIPGKFYWGRIHQIKLQLLGDRGKMLRGRPVIRKKGVTAVEEIKRDEVKTTVELGQNYGNPFGREGTTIPYTINESVQKVTVKIVNLLGRTVRTIDYLPTTKGSHATYWDARDDNGNLITNGTYFIKIEFQDKNGILHYTPQAKKGIKMGLLYMFYKFGRSPSINQSL